MKLYVSMAWRNIWRNPRRTGVILLAVIIGVWSMVFLGAYMRGISSGMIKNGISTLTGHIQIHHKNYRNDPVIENSMTDFKTIESLVKQSIPEGSLWTSRIRVSAVASNARHSTGLNLVGVNPEQEAQISFIGSSISSGRFLKKEEKNGIVIGDALLEKFETGIGKKLVLMSQDKTGEIASKAYRIIGTFDAEMQSTEKAYVFVSISSVRKMLKLEDEISEISILLPEKSSDRNVAKNLEAALNDKTLSVETWKELLPILEIYLKMMDGFIIIWSVVIFIAMSFGIINTSLMAVFERMREFGLMKALGMKPFQIVKEVVTESLIMLIIGITAGNLLGIISVKLLANKGIDLSAFAEGVEFAGMTRVIYPEISIQDIGISNIIVFGLGIIVSIYPAVKASRFTPVEAMAHN